VAAAPGAVSPAHHAGLNPLRCPDAADTRCVYGNPALNGAAFFIGGHTDTTGSDSYNQSLLDRRAEAVTILLAELDKVSDWMTFRG
jgi:hypothetical protein